MANTTTIGPGVIHIVPDGTTDWSYITHGGFVEDVGMKVESVQFIPSAANDRLILRNKTVATGTIIHDTGDSASDAAIYDPVDPPGWECPVMDATDCTFGTAANCRIIIRYS